MPTFESSAVPAAAVGDGDSRSIISPQPNVIMAAVPVTSGDQHLIAAIDVSGTPSFELPVAINVQTNAGDGSAIAQITEDTILLVYDEAILTAEMKILNGAA